MVERGSWRVFWRGLWAVILSGVFLVAVPGARPDPGGESFQALGIARDHLFDFAAWEAGALFDKATTALLAPQRYMTEGERSQFVRDYFLLVKEILSVEREIESLYIAPEIGNPDLASLPLRARRDDLRAEQQARQALAEAIIQAQTAEVAREAGFGFAGQVLPPIQMRFTRLPTLLVISPRDRIERTGAYPLEHGLTVERQEAIEGSVEQELGVSALIVPLGGLAVYPAMLVETDNLAFAFEVTAHEWMHHYLTFYPLGFNYGTTPELYTMNETVASIVGKELSQMVLSRYYPDLAPPPPDYTPVPPPQEEPAPQPESETPAFDFRAEMHKTRVRVDELLAAGQIEEAEAYMEARRLVFLENGYRIRKLNQAYFAFYGSYADQPGSSGADPIGPAIREVRYYSASLSEFISRVRGLTTSEQLFALLEEVRQDGSSG
ncbi:MAG: hypothetical protein Kow00124_07150 [Anaerolineae bacterium]